MAAVVDSGAAEPDDVFTVPDSIVREGVDRSRSGDFAHARGLADHAVGHPREVEQRRHDERRRGDGQERAARLPRQVRLRQQAGHRDAGRVSRGRWARSGADLQRDTISYGQGISTTIVHLASAYGALANDGLRMPPRLVEAVVESDGAERARAARRSQCRWSARRRRAGHPHDGSRRGRRRDGQQRRRRRLPDRRKDWHRAAARRARGSRSGASPHSPGLRRQTILSWWSWCPCRTRRSVASGGGTAGPVFADIMKFALPRLGIAPTGTPAPKVPLFADELRAAN